MSHSVLIIGNGFDLNLGLKTSYRDYMSSHFFKDRLNLGYELFDYLHEQTDIENWIDIEKELAIFSKNKSSYDSFLKDYTLLCDTLKNYLLSLDLKSINKKSEAYKFLVETFDENTTILNFNYTNSVHHILENTPFSNEIISQNIKHVHGSVKEDDIIFGVDDASRINPKDTFLYKSTSSYYSGRDVNTALNKFDNLIVFGHSLGESDHMYFKSTMGHLAYNESLNKNMILYYYTDEGKYSLYRQLHTLTINRVSKLKDNVNFHEFDTLLV